MDIPKGAYWPKICLLAENVPIKKNKKSQLFSVFKCICDINLFSYVAQSRAINKKSNISTISYYIDIDM